MAATKWTEHQQQAIDARGGTLLVSAGAGSGKTAVLTERVLSRLTDPVQPVDANHLLIVTFTNASATEMRQRIAKKLQEKLREQPGDPLLRRQSALLEQASISTVHAFCQNLIRPFLAELGYAPDSRLADEKELSLWEEETAQTVLEEAYETGDRAFLDLIELFSTKRDDRPVFDVLKTFYRFLRSHPFYEDWLERSFAMYDSKVPLTATPWGQILLQQGREIIRLQTELAAQALRYAKEDEKVLKGYGPSLESDLAMWEKINTCAENGTWEDLREAAASLSFPRIGTVRDPDDPGLIDTIKAIRDGEKKAADQLKTRIFTASEDEYREDLEALRPQIKTLFDLILRYDAVFTEIKKDHHAIDFSDLEHLTLRLLWTGRGDSRVPTDLAKELGSSFEEIYVDEYQDTNEVQERIFTALSKEGNNLFLVGDLKQSIYQFRMASPRLFREKKEQYPAYDPNAPRFPAKIDLVENFRSREEVLGGINYFFERIMRRDCGGVDYHDGESLVCGNREYPTTPGVGVEFRMLDLSEVSPDQRPIWHEANYVAASIDEMLRSGQMVYDNDEKKLRPMLPGDICILMRSPKDSAGIFLEALERYGIPALAQARKGFLTSREISAVLAVLEVVDNPLQDIELVAALRSPIFSYSFDEITKLRLVDRKAPLFANLTKQAEEGEQRARGVLAILSELRRKASVLTSDELIMELLDRSGLESVVLATNGGRLRRQNLRLLVQYAKEYEGRGYHGIAAFLRLTRKLKETNEDLSEASVLGSSARCVQILTIHGSKGLEFPVVFYCNLEKQYNETDLRSAFALHPTLGFACNRRDFQKGIQYPSIPLEAMRIDLRNRSRSEEIRLAYVAMTRARERLILVGAMKDPIGKMQKQQNVGETSGALPASYLLAQNNTMDLLLAALNNDPLGKAEICKGNELNREIPWAKGTFKVILAMAQDEPEEIEVRKDEFLEQEDPVLLESFSRRADYVYPRKLATMVPTNLSVSFLAHPSFEGYHFRSRPTFLYAKGLTPTERGNAHHKFMQYCDFKRAKEDPKAECERLVAAGFLSPEEGQAVETERIRAFFDGALGQRVFRADNIRREFRFWAEVDGAFLKKYTTYDIEDLSTTVQGVADLVLIEDGEAVIVDYKTDRIDDGAQLEQKYRLQLLLYRRMVSQILGIRVKECLLYSFWLNKALPIKYLEDELL